MLVRRRLGRWVSFHLERSVTLFWPFLLPGYSNPCFVFRDMARIAYEDLGIGQGLGLTLLFSNWVHREALGSSWPPWLRFSERRNRDAVDSEFAGDEREREGIIISGRERDRDDEVPSKAVYAAGGVCVHQRLAFVVHRTFALAQCPIRMTDLH